MPVPAAFLTPRRQGGARCACGPALLFAVATLVGCATSPRKVTRIVNGRVIVTRAISPDAYSHVARALMYEEEQQWDEAARELQRALPFDDAGAELRAHLADLFVRLGRLDDAAEQVRRSLQIAETVEGHLAAAHVAEARRDVKGALGHYRKGASFALSDESPDAVERAHLALADAELGAVEVDAAFETLRKLTDVAPDSVRARVQLGALAWALGRVPVATSALGEALRLEPADLEARLTMAALLVATDRIPEAKTAYRETLERTDDAVEIAEMFLKWLVARGDKAEAAAEADRLTPDVVDEGTVEGIIRVEGAAGRAERAVAAADQAIRKGVSAARVTLWLAGALLDAKDHAGAADRLLKLSRTGPAAASLNEFIESRLRAAEALREAPGSSRLGEAARALEEAAAAIATAKQPSAAANKPKGSSAGTSAAEQERDWSVDLVVARALLDEKRGDAVRAARTLDTALAAEPTSARLLLVRAAIDERQGEWRTALAFAERILKADSRNFEALNFHGFVSADHGQDLPSAMRRLQVAMALNPGRGGVVDSLGWAYLNSGNLERAGDLLAQADRLEPGDPEILMHLGDLFAKRREVARAIETYRRALTLLPSERVAREIQGKLGALGPRSAAGR